MGVWIVFFASFLLTFFYKLFVKWRNNLKKKSFIVSMKTSLIFPDKMTFHLSYFIGEFFVVVCYARVTQKDVLDTFNSRVHKVQSSIWAQQQPGKKTVYCVELNEVTTRMAQSFLLSVDSIQLLFILCSWVLFLCSTTNLFSPVVSHSVSIFFPVKW